MQAARISRDSTTSTTSGSSAAKASSDEISARTQSTHDLGGGRKERDNAPVTSLARHTPSTGAKVASVSPWTAQRLGGIVGALLAVAGVVWLRTRVPPCPGAVTLEFHPPLADPGRYRFELLGANDKPCAFTLTLPMTGKDEAANGASTCGMARELRTQVRDGEASVVALTFAAAPERFTLRVTRNGERIYDTPLVPKYAPYATLRAENKHFCGDRARIVPECLRNSSECQPFPARCTGPDTCPNGQACCLTPEWGRDFGPHAASECSTKSSCLAHLGQLACHTDRDCPSELHCQASSLSGEFSPAVLGCR